MKPTAHQLALNYGMMSVEEVDLLKRCADELPLNPIVVNIGAGRGTSALAIFEERPAAFVFSLDKKTVPEEIATVIQAGYGSRIARIWGPSQRIAIDWPLPIDLLFVDGAHDVEGLEGDLTWIMKVKPGGFVLFHDYDHRNVPHVTGIVDERMKDFERVGKERYLVAFRI